MLFCVSVGLYLSVFLAYIVLTGGIHNILRAAARLPEFWPVYATMVAVAGLQSAIWRYQMKVGEASFFRLVAWALAAVVPVVLVLYLVPGWLVLIPFFLLPGFLASLIGAAIVHDKLSPRAGS
ncbi:hypothetical protein IDVR_32210 [Intrasporangium sp. DVR]